MPSPSTKIHQLHYTDISTTSDESKEVLAVSTEDGRILFYFVASSTLSQSTGPEGKSQISICRAVGQLGGSEEGLVGRIKDFEILKPPDMDGFFIVTGSSDGAIRLWMVQAVDLQGPRTNHDDSSETELGDQVKSPPNEATIKTPNPKQVGKLIGAYEAGNRITCLKAFIMSEPVDSKAKGLHETSSANKANGLGLEGDKIMADKLLRHKYSPKAH